MFDDDSGCTGKACDPLADMTYHGYRGSSGNPKANATLPGLQSIAPLFRNL